LKERFN